MIFPSNIFLFFFLPLVLGAYYLFPHKVRNFVILVASLFFYAWGEPKYFFVMIISIVFNYSMGVLIHKYKLQKKIAQIIISLTVVANIGMLIYFKYLDFFIKTLNDLANTEIAYRNIHLPIGISFFTFQALSYVIDVYRGEGEYQKSPYDVAMYISFFPQLIAGPIVRYQTISNQIDDGQRESFDKFSSGSVRFVIGLAKKVIIADHMAIIADGIFGLDPAVIPFHFAWLGIVSYSLQIYFDFSGYSDMAIGLGKMFGFEFLENFTYPYISKSITEFWRRWHISLGTWFRDYVYIPMGGNRSKTSTRRLFNLFTVWLLTGLWHGASWNFVVWGLWFFVFISLEKYYNFDNLFKSRVLKHAYSIIVVIIGWVFFRSATLTDSILYLKAMLGLNEYVTSINGLNYFKYYMGNYSLFLILAIVFSTPVYAHIGKLSENIRRVGRSTHVLLEGVALSYYIAIFAITIMYIVSSKYTSFIYFRF